MTFPHMNTMYFNTIQTPSSSLSFILPLCGPSPSQALFRFMSFHLFEFMDLDSAYEKKFDTHLSLAYLTYDIISFFMANNIPHFLYPYIS
jgi:hypothetical protein